MGERLTGSQKVMGSSPTVSISKKPGKPGFFVFHDKSHDKIFIDITPQDDKPLTQ